MTDWNDSTRLMLSNALIIIAGISVLYTAWKWVLPRRWRWRWYRSITSRWVDWTRVVRNREAFWISADEVLPSDEHVKSFAQVKKERQGPRTAIALSSFAWYRRRQGDRWYRPCRGGVFHWVQKGDLRANERGAHTETYHDRPRRTHQKAKLARE